MQRFKDYVNRNALNQSQHQYDGIKWCYDIEKKGACISGQTIHSGILADEMGLGKTIQMVGLILVNFKLHTLIVLPRALLEQWEKFIIQTLQHKPIIYHGHNIKKITLDVVYESPIVITTYGIITKCKMLHEITWDRIIFDEAHHLRNKKSQVHNASVRIKATHKWLVTGTPIQNYISDFYGLCVVLGLDPINVCRENVLNIVDKVVLKRMKSQVGIVLPKIKRTLINVEWEDEEEKEMAKTIHEQLVFSRMHKGEGTSGLHIFKLLHQAKQSCIAMNMIQKNKHFQSKINKVVNVILERNNGASKLIFCHYRYEIEQLQSQLVSYGLQVEIIDGKTNTSSRIHIIQRRDIDVLILQIQTGCEGLNLQHYSEVYFVSPHWNPAVEDQSIARTHRIGQEKQVEVFTFKMEPLDDTRQSRTFDSHVKHVQRIKREDMEKIAPIKYDNVTCSICLSSNNTNAYSTLDCGHIFHKSCIDEWFIHGDSCPICRQ